MKTTRVWLDSGDIKNVGTELLAEFKTALTPEVFQRGYRLGDVLCQGEGAEAFNQALALENTSPLHLVFAGYVCLRNQAKPFRQEAELSIK